MLVECACGKVTYTLWTNTLLHHNMVGGLQALHIWLWADIFVGQWLLLHFFVLNKVRMRKRPVIHVTMHVAFTTLEGGGGPFNHILLSKGGTLQSYSALEGGDPSIIFCSWRGGHFNHILLSKGGTLQSYSTLEGGTLQSYSTLEGGDPSIHTLPGGNPSIIFYILSKEGTLLSTHCHTLRTCNYIPKD